MSVAFDTSVGTNGNGANSLVLPNLTTSGPNELLLMGTHVSNTDSVSTITGDASMTWVRIGTLTIPTTSGKVEIWRTLATKTLSSTAFTVNFASGFPQNCAIIMAFSGVNTTGANGSGAIGTVKSASSGSWSDATVTYVSNTANTLGAAFIGQTANNVITAGSGQTLESQQTSAGTFSRATGLIRNALTTAAGTSVTMNGTFTATGAGIWAVEIVGSNAKRFGNNLRPHPFSPGSAR